MEWKFFWIKARLQLVTTEDGGRKSPIATGYRPGFCFIENHQTSGWIELINSQALQPGGEDDVYVAFYTDKYLTGIAVGKSVNFFEGPRKIGSIKVQEIFGIADGPG